MGTEFPSWSPQLFSMGLVVCEPLQGLGASSIPSSETLTPPPPRPTLLLSRPQSQSGANQSSNLDSYLNAQSLLGHPAAVGFSAVQRGKGILNPQLLTCLLKDVIVGLTEVFEHLFPLVNAHQQIALVGFVL